MAAGQGFDLGQQLHPKIRSKGYGYNPRGEQRKAHYPEDVSRILASGRPSEPHWHETNDGHKRARQHWSSSMTPCVSGGPDAVPPFLHFDHHDLDGDDRVINQKAKAEDQSAERDAIEYSSGQKHDDKDGRQRQRNGRCHNDSFAPTEADNANDHHDGKSDKELQHELIHCFADVYCLIRHFAEADTYGQVGGNLLLFGNKSFAEVQTVPALLHHDAEKQGRLAIMTNKKGCGIFVSALYIGNIRKLYGPPGRHNGRIPNLLKIIERAIQANVNLLSFRIDRPRWGYCILANQRIEDISCA